MLYETLLQLDELVMQSGKHEMYAVVNMSRDDRNSPWYECNGKRVRIVPCHMDESGMALHDGWFCIVKDDRSPKYTGEHYFPTHQIVSLEIAQTKRLSL